MAYIGNTVENQGFTPAIDYFNGNGVTVTFTLSRPIASVAQVIVAVDNVIQNPSSAFGVVGNSITFTSAPLSGTNNIWVEYTSLITTYQGISQDPTVIGDIRATGGYLAEGDFGNSFIDGNLIDYVTGAGRITVGELDNITFYHGGTSARSEMMDLYYAGGAKIYGTTALTIPVGTTAQRPTGATGMIRMNSTTGSPEWYDSVGAVWVAFYDSRTFSANFLVVAGGGGGGGSNGNSGGGGGAGGYRELVEQPLLLATNYTVTVGAGGAVTTNATGSDGSNSVFNTVTSTGGGGGGTAAVGRNGGSGGGGGQGSFAGGSGNTPSTTPSQGNNGGDGQGSATPYRSGGGGGASAVGATGAASGNGGAGISSLITETAVTRAGGGGGGAYETLAGAGGAGGGGAGGLISGNGTAGTANTGGGGGGAARSGTVAGVGGSGVVIIKYPNTLTISNSGGGLTFTTATASGFKVTTFTAGTGNIQFA